jgi:hypothetical protein
LSLYRLVPVMARQRITSVKFKHQKDVWSPSHQASHPGCLHALQQAYRLSCMHPRNPGTPTFVQADVHFNSREVSQRADRSSHQPPHLASGMHTSISSPCSTHPQAPAASPALA